MTRRLRVAVIGELDPSAAEGMATVVSNLAAELERGGSDVAVLAAATRKRSHVVEPAHISTLRQLRPHVVLYIPRSGLTAASAFRIAVLRRAVAPARVRPLVLQASSGSLPRMLPLVTLVPSQRLHDMLAERGARAHVVPIGVDDARFAPGEARETEVWPEPPRAPRVLHVGHVKPSRNVQVLVEFARRGCDCALVASPATEPNATLLRVLLEAGVTVVREKVANIEEVYRQADTYVFPVIDERGCIEVPLSVLEAYASGTRIVTTPFGAVPELFAEDKSVTIVDPAQLVPAVLASFDTAPPAGRRKLPSWRDSADRLLEALEAAAFAPRSVLLTGLDGTGKSTQAARLQLDAEQRGVAATYLWARWDPLLLKPIMRLVRQRRTSGADVAESDDALGTKRRIFESRFRRALWRYLVAFDYASRTIPRLAVAYGRSEMVIIDRYYYDALVDMGANFGASAPEPPWPLRMLPRPHKVILLDVDEEVIVSGGVARLLEAAKAAVSQTRGTVWVARR